MARTIAKVFGIVFVLLGILGFFVPFTGLLDLTVTHDIIHLVIGIVLLAGSGSTQTSQKLATVFGAVYLVVAILGFFVQNVLGILTLDLADNILHLVLAIILLYVGLSKSASMTNTSAKA